MFGSVFKKHMDLLFFLSFQKFNQADILNHYEVFRSRIAFEINHYM